MAAVASIDVPLSLYVHLPWCIRKCPYCDFNSHAIGDGAPREVEYVDALIRDLRHARKTAPQQHLASIFFGGGTPSLFSAAQLGRFLDVVRAEFHCAPDMEITLEANPGAAEAERFRGYRDIGVNRLSIYGSNRY